MRGNIRNTLSNALSKRAQVTHKPVTTPKNLADSLKNHKPLTTAAPRPHASVSASVSSRPAAPTSFSPKTVPSHSSQSRHFQPARSFSSFQQRSSQNLNSNNNNFVRRQSQTSAPFSSWGYTPSQPFHSSRAYNANTMPYQTPYPQYYAPQDYSFYGYDTNQVVYYTPVMTYYAPVYAFPYPQEYTVPEMAISEINEAPHVAESETSNCVPQTEEIASSQTGTTATEESQELASQSYGGSEMPSRDPRAYHTTPVYSRKTVKPSFQAFAQNRRAMTTGRNPFHTQNRKFSTAAPRTTGENEKNAEFIDEEFTDEMSEVSDSSYLSVQMTVDDLFVNIQKHLEQHPTCKVSWLNRMLAKSVSEDDFYKSFYILNQFIERRIDTTPETGTLFVKAACRAGLPEEALKPLKNVKDFRLFPTLGGIHYLMINFSLRKETDNVISAFSLCELRNVAPTMRTYHILIRECVDNGLIEDALVFAKTLAAEEIVPNRVTYNILMNGCRQAGKFEEILALREQMNQHKLEINDTTVKFTVVAHLMLDNLEAAVSEFKSFPGLDTKIDSFCQRFMELFSDHEQQLLTFFARLDKEGLALPAEIKQKLTAEPLATESKEEEQSEQKEEEHPEQKEEGESKDESQVAEKKEEE